MRKRPIVKCMTVAEIKALLERNLYKADPQAIALAMLRIAATPRLSSKGRGKS
jgi:hypothetical protein